MEVLPQTIISSSFMRTSQTVLLSGQRVLKPLHLAPQPLLGLLLGYLHPSGISHPPSAKGKAYVCRIPRMKHDANGNNGPGLYLHWIASKRLDAHREHTIPRT